MFWIYEMYKTELRSISLTYEQTWDFIGELPSARIRDATFSPPYWLIKFFAQSTRWHVRTGEVVDWVACMYKLPEVISTEKPGGRSFLYEGKKGEPALKTLLSSSTIFMPCLSYCMSIYSTWCGSQKYHAAYIYNEKSHFIIGSSNLSEHSTVLHVLTI